MEQATFSLKTLRGYIKSISGLFISSYNPGGLTPKELDILTAFVFLIKEEDEKRITPSIKSKVAEMFNYPPQVITNYVKKLRDKRILSQTNELHPILYVNKITISFAEAEKTENNLQSGSLQ